MYYQENCLWGSFMVDVKVWGRSLVSGEQLTDNFG